MCVCDFWLVVCLILGCVFDFVGCVFDFFGCVFYCRLVVCFISPPDRKGLVDFMLESAFATLLHHAPTRAARQSGSPVDPNDYPARVSPSIPPERLASGSRRVSRQSSWPGVPELLASESRRVSRQSGSPLASGSRRVCR